MDVVRFSVVARYIMAIAVITATQDGQADELVWTSLNDPSLVATPIGADAQGSMQQEPVDSGPAIPDSMREKATRKSHVGETQSPQNSIRRLPGVARPEQHELRLLEAVGSSSFQFRIEPMVGNDSHNENRQRVRSSSPDKLKTPSVRRAKSGIRFLPTVTDEKPPGEERPNRVENVRASTSRRLISKLRTTTEPHFFPVQEPIVRPLKVLDAKATIRNQYSSRVAIVNRNGKAGQTTESSSADDAPEYRVTEHRVGERITRVPLPRAVSIKSDKARRRAILYIPTPLDVDSLPIED